MGLKPISVCVHDFSVCLLYFFSTQNLVPLKVDTGLPLLQEAESEEPDFPLLQEGGSMKSPPALPWCSNQLDLHSLRTDERGRWAVAV